MKFSVLLLLTFSGAVVSCQQNAPAVSDGVVDHAASVQTTERSFAAEPQVWITAGEEALPALTQSLRAGPAPLLGPKKNGIVTLKVRESQLLALAQVMHRQFHRCAGFEAHDTEAQAVAALEAPAPQASAISYTVDNAAVVNTLLGSLTGSNVLATMTQLGSYKTRFYTTATGAQAAQWLKTHWETLAQGRTDVTVEAFAHSWAQPSIILTITGQTLPAEVVILGGHLDSINLSDTTGGTAPGVDDDASGIATLTEVIRSAMTNGYKPARTVKFIAYAAEEVGLRGSNAIATKFKADGVNVVGVLQLDMTNFKGSSADIVTMTDFTDSAQNAFIHALVNTYAKVSVVDSQCGYACSDHASWTAKGYRASMPFESYLEDSNPRIHTADDTLANSGGTVDHSMKFVKLSAAYVAELAKGGFEAGPVRDTTPPTSVLTSPRAGATVRGTVTVAADATDNVAVVRVRFDVDGVNRSTDETPPYTFEWNTSADAPGMHTLTAQAWDSSANKTTSVAVVVTVAAGPAPDAGPAGSIAAFDSARKAPACTVAAVSCDTAALLTGRGPLGPELNAPNTVNASCADGTRGAFHVDESIERLVISSVNGAVLKAGTTAKIDATVWAFSVANDKIDLYSSPTVSAPAWTLIKTLSPTVKGLGIVSATFTLPAGSQQAIRAHIRYKGTQSPCGTAGFDDEDDLIFNVAP